MVYIKESKVFTNKYYFIEYLLLIVCIVWLSDILGHVQYTSYIEAPGVFENVTLARYRNNDLGKKYKYMVIIGYVNILNLKTF